MIRNLLILCAISFFTFGIFFIFLQKSTIVIQPEPSFSVVNLTPDPSPSPAPTTIVLGGDVMLGRKVNAVLSEKGDYFHAFLHIEPILKNADIAIINLESPIIEGCPIVRASTFKFCTSPESAKAIAKAGIDFVSLANNHYLDYGSKGLNETIRFLEKENVIPILQAKPVFKKIDGKSFGILAFNLTWPGLKETEIIEIVNDTKAKSDFVIISLHWGDEYKNTPSKSQQVFAHALIDNGANIIFGHHSHYIQPIERYNNGLIFYSLGNLIFDQMWSEKTRIGVLVKLLIYGKEIDFELFPTEIYEFAQPRLLEADEKEKIISEMLYSVPD
ncbi:MAG: CapA family protein [Candidatus Paceibacteria bacterium]